MLVRIEKRLEEWLKFVQDRQINDLADNILQTELQTPHSNELGGSTPKFASPSMRRSHELINMPLRHPTARTTSTMSIDLAVKI